MSTLKAVLFDADGVLLDSLPAHLRICEELSQEYGLNLRIPSQSELKEKVRTTGVLISPMEEFFLAVGFGSELSKRADLRYKEIFSGAYKYGPFPHVHEMLEQLHRDGYQMGIVTSNIKANVTGALGDSANLFRTGCICSKDGMSDFSKSKGIISVLSVLRVSPTEAIYVGDQRPDWQAATDAGVGFLGVSYGWGLSNKDTDLAIVQDVPAIYRYVSARPDCVV